MIEIIKEKGVPRAEIECSNCGSILRYGNADLYQRVDYTYGTNGIYKYYLVCPVCGCEISADWIYKKES